MAIRRTYFLSCGNLDKTPMKNFIDFDARELSSIGELDFIVGVGENKRSYALSAVVYGHCTV